jgi:predicted XRE-type DNA-binding protein
MTKKEREAWMKDRMVVTNALTRKAEAMPGYADVLAETIAENEAAGIARQIAKKSKLTQKEIAKRMNVSQPRISQIVNGEDLSLSTLYRYAAACGAKLHIAAVFEAGLGEDRTLKE